MRGSVFVVFFFKQKTAYEMRMSDWSSDVCSSDLVHAARDVVQQDQGQVDRGRGARQAPEHEQHHKAQHFPAHVSFLRVAGGARGGACPGILAAAAPPWR